MERVVTSLIGHEQTPQFFDKLGSPDDTTLILSWLRGPNPTITWFGFSRVFGEAG
jgi:hypothetical protein